jgi:hypothetical protein
MGLADPLGSYSCAECSEPGREVGLPALAPTSSPAVLGRLLDVVESRRSSEIDPPSPISQLEPLDSVLTIAAEPPPPRSTLRLDELVESRRPEAGREGAAAWWVRTLMPCDESSLVMLVDSVVAHAREGGREIDVSRTLS